MTSQAIPKSFKEETGFSEFKFSELSKEASTSYEVKSVPATFTLSIPNLGISNAKVETNSTNLDPKNLLGHYKGTAIPGEVGNALIYGHSVLPIFFNPKDYKTIFSTLPKLKVGDNFYINFNGKELSYEVVDKITLKPSEVDVFDQNPAKIPGENSTVTLMTCVPPGARTFRLLVVGKLLTQ